ncbi:hypothetical protein VAE122_2430005 [Vibrio aestuarianus]|nr:hypothetical protein VAE122_2430005 [Vibrio aestuarianus]
MVNEASKLLCNENIELMLLISREKPESLASFAGQTNKAA